MKSEDSWPRYKAFRKAEIITTISIFVPTAVLYLTAASPALGRPIKEGYPWIVLSIIIFIISVIIQKRLNIRLQAKYGMLCPNCPPKQITNPGDRANLIRGECPRCLTKLPAQD